MNTVRIAKAMTILNLFCLTPAFAETFYHALRSAGDHDRKSVEDARRRTFETEKIQDANEFSKNAKVSPVDPVVVNEVDTGVEDEGDKPDLSDVTAETKSEKVQQNPKTNYKIKSYHDSVEKTVDVNKDNIPEELIFPIDENVLQKPTPAKALMPSKLKK